MDAIEYKQHSKPELGRILTDKAYKVQPKKKETAIWAYAKDQPQIVL